MHPVINIEAKSRLILIKCLYVACIIIILVYMYVWYSATEQKSRFFSKEVYTLVLM